MTLRVDTDRLSIRPWPRPDTPDTRAALEAMLTPAVLAPLPPGLQRVGDPAEWIADRHANSAVFAMHRRVDGKVIGMLQLAPDADPDADPDAATPTYRLGYMLAEHAWGQGYGTEAVAALLAALARQGPAEVLAGAVAANLGSIRVLEKCGFTCAAHPDAPDMVLCKLSLSPTEP